MNGVVVVFSTDFHKALNVCEETILFLNFALYNYSSRSKREEYQYSVD